MSSKKRPSAAFFQRVVKAAESKLAEPNSIEALSVFLGVSVAGLRKWKNGEVLLPRRATIAVLAARLAISQKWLVTGEGDPQQPDERRGILGPLPVTARQGKYSLAVVGHVGAGSMIEPRADSGDEKWSEIDLLEDPGEGSYGLIVAGDSLEPYVPEGSRLIVSPTTVVGGKTEAVNGQIIVARHNFQSYTVVKVYARHAGKEEMCSYQAKYKPIEMKPGEWSIIGVVTQVIIPTIRRPWELPQR